MTNAEFLNVISRSFKEFIASGTSRSNRKLKPLHGSIAKDIATRLGDSYKVFSQGYEADKEKSIVGHYFEKLVDISIQEDEKMVCGIAVKFVMQNYSQNSNNYFENMLGETANIRSGNCPYFQIFIILDELPYYRKDKSISRWETFTVHNAEKYLILSKDDTTQFMHTPDKTLIYVVHIPENRNITNQSQYFEYYSSMKDVGVTLSQKFSSNFDDAVILNDYELFMDKVYHKIKSL